MLTFIIIAAVSLVFAVALEVLTTKKDDRPAKCHSSIE